MRKKNKKILFYISVLFFIVLSFWVVLLALGYKYDFVQNKFFKTGSLELRTNVKAEVYINDELAGNTSFLSDYFSKGQLLPRTYNVRLENDKFQSWHKLVKIEAGFLTSFPKIVLLPQNFDINIISSSSIGNITIKRFDIKNNLALIGNRRKIESIDLKTGESKTIKILPKIIPPDADVISFDGNKKLHINEHEIWVTWIGDSDYQPLKSAGDTELITRFSQTIEDVQWFKDSNHLIVSVGGILKFLEIDNRGGLNIFDIATINGPFYYDRDQNTIFRFEANKLEKINF